MTTATVQKPITEAEIRALLDARSARYPTDSFPPKLDEAIGIAFDTIAYVALDEQGRYDFGDSFLSDTWGDLRPSEQDRLGGIIAECRLRVERKAREVIIEAVVDAALTFAAEYPDAPRAAAE